MTRVQIADTLNFELISTPFCLLAKRSEAKGSYGNGLSYELRNKNADDSIYLQGDDATQFREELDAMENADPMCPTDTILNELWNTYYTE